MTREETMTQAQLKERLHYDPETGIFTWKERPRNDFASPESFPTWNKRFAGKPAGSISNRGYYRIKFWGVPYMSHRLAWLYVHGEWPENEIDHINGVKTDNRISNLREADRLINLANMPVYKNSLTGIHGVSWSKTKGKWQANVYRNKVSYYLGVFDDYFEACCARKSAENRLDFHVNHGRAAA